MKNYFQKIMTLFTGNDYPESTQQDFYKWLVDEEHTVEKDEALQKLWDDAHKRGTAADMQEAYELLKKNAGIPSVPRKRTIRPIHIWQAVAAVFFLGPGCFRLLFSQWEERRENTFSSFFITLLPPETKAQDSYGSLF